jgi:hypothetical protein
VSLIKLQTFVDVKFYVGGFYEILFCDDFHLKLKSGDHHVGSLYSNEMLILDTFLQDVVRHCRLLPGLQPAKVDPQCGRTFLRSSLVLLSVFRSRRRRILVLVYTHLGPML